MSSSDRLEEVSDQQRPKKKIERDKKEEKREGKGRENVFSACRCCLSNVVNVKKEGKEQGEAEVLWRIESIVLRAAGCLSNFDLCSKASLVLKLCFARGDAISGRVKDLSLRLCSGGQVNCWWRRLGFLCPPWAG